MKDLKTIIWLTLAALGFRIFLYFLFANEIVITPDPMEMCSHGQQFASGNYYGVLSTYWTPVYPILIGILTFFTNSAIVSAIIISIVASCLIVPLTYCLVKQSFGQQVAIIAAVISVFFPHLINSMFEIGTENVYILWIIGALIVGWNGFQSNSAKDFFFVGVLLGLAYLTRPEAFGYIPFFIFVIIGKNLWQKKSLLGWNTSKPIFTLLIGFSLLASPYIFYLKQQTGFWTISGKIQVNTIVGDFEDYYESADAKLDEAEKPGLKDFLKDFSLNLIKIQKSFSFLVPILLFVVIGLGLFAAAWDKERLLRESYLIVFCCLTILGYAASVVQDRYFYVLLPIFFGWIALGIVKLEDWFQKSIQNFSQNRILNNINQNSVLAFCLLIIFVYVLPLNLFIRTKEKAWEITQYEERDAGLWLKENGKPSALVFSPIRRPVFYSGLQQLPHTSKTIEETLSVIKEKKADYIITSERSLKRNPSLNGFTEVLENSGEFELIYDRKDHPNYRISIFKVK